MKNVSIGIAYFSVFIDVLGLSMMMVILPFLALYYNANSAQIGLMFASYAGCQMISIPISGRLSDYFGRRPLLLASLLGSCFGFLVQGLSTNFGILVFGRALWKTLEYGFMAMAFASMSVFIQGGLYPYLIKYFGKHGLIILGSCCMVIGNLSFAAVRSRQKFRAMPLLIISLFFLCFGFSILSPSITAVLSRYAPADRQGAILGTSQGLQALSRVLGPLLFGGLFGINAASCYIVASFFALVSALFAAFALNTSIKFKSNITHHLEEQQQEHISQPTYLSQQQQILLENQRLRTRLAKFEQRESPLSSSSSKAHFVDLELASNSGDSKVPRKSNNACIPLTLSPDDDNVPIELTPSIRNSRPPPCLPSLRYDDDDDQQSWFSEIHLNTLRHLVRGTPHPVF
uniref:Major facilitator superfamily (MFS) profile domain-containing protein n=1 Tax=Aureoumbra lagunensis TaxID=44058 RepID=A0A7S3K2E7_9STRA